MTKVKEMDHGATLQKLCGTGIVPFTLLFDQI